MPFTALFTNSPRGRVGARSDVGALTMLEVSVLCVCCISCRVCSHHIHNMHPFISNDFPLHLPQPTTDAIKKCEAMNYCPSVFVLSPGQMVHINKGRLHAFRKLSPFALPPADCHADLRAAVLERSENPSIEETCVSVAWDWEYKGVTSEGINREMVSTLECAKLNREYDDAESLAIPETCILFMARRCVSEYERQSGVPQDDAVRRKLPAFLASRSIGSGVSTADSVSKNGDEFLKVLRGLLPSLKYVVQRHKRAFEQAKQTMEAMEANEEEMGKLSFAPWPDTREAPDRATMDPWSDGDMKCRGCGAEISQCYMHCNGCEEKLSKDFNICVECHKNRETCADGAQK